MLHCPKPEENDDGGFCASVLFNTEEESEPLNIPKAEEMTPCIFKEEEGISRPGPSSTFSLDTFRVRKDVFDLPQLHEAIVMPAMLGKHSVLYYRKYDNDDNCWSFQWKRDCKSGIQAYVCSVCKLKGYNTKVLNYKFLTDPSMLPHACKPLNWPMEAAKRRFFEATKSLRASANAADTPADFYKRMVDNVMEDRSLSYQEKVLQIHAMGPFEKHRRALSRAVNAPTRVTAIVKRKLDEEKVSAEVETGMGAVEQLLVALKETREMLQQPPLKKPKVEEQLL